MSAERQIVMPVPTVAPLGVEFLPEYAQEVWDAFVKPDQASGMPQSTEMRMLMALLRAFHEGVVEVRPAPLVEGTDHDG